jgi:hypothetical protein
MSISAMKQALEALESWQKTCLDCGRGSEELGRATQPITALRQAIAEAEKPKMRRATREEKIVNPGVYEVPVHASDISQECVDETAKDRHEWVGLDGDIPGLGLVTEEFYNGMLCAEDILRKRNT